MGINDGGVCGTCAQPARATAENEGYSDCCNDRIEYGDEAAASIRRATDELQQRADADRAEELNQEVRDGVEP